MMPMTKSKALLGNAGTYYVAAELLRRDTS